MQRRVKSEYKPWITGEIKQLSYRIIYHLKSAHYNTACKKCKNEVTHHLRTTKENYFKGKLGKTNKSKESWQATNESLNKKT